ncbi:MAG: hypothetical protein DMF79_07690, partial [Acidobacteria bacterium]
LGLLREAEERRAVGRALIENVYNLDAVDFYYTVSAPLTEGIWRHEAVLEKVVRIVRLTRPEVIVTMNPAPSPGNHGNHQYAARLAIEAFQAAADPSRFPDQLRKEGLGPFRVKRIFRSGASGSGPQGPDCPSTFKKEDPTETVASVWQGTMSRRFGKTWAQIGEGAAREYVSQGWSGLSLPAEAGCNRFTQVASRVPHDPESTAPTGALEGALVPAPGGLPRGTELYLTSATFDAVAGEPFRVTAHVRSAGPAMADASVSLSLPDGWAAIGNGCLGLVSGPAESTATFTVTPPAGVPPGRFRIGATLTDGEASGRTAAVVRLVPAVQGRVERLPQVAQFEKWARDVGVPQLGSTVKPVLSLGVGETRTIRVDLHNWGARAQAGTVSLVLPPGFSAIPASRAYRLAAGADASVTFDVTNRDTALPTANQGGVRGDYDAQAVTTSSAGTSNETFGLELVPVTTIPRAAAAPVVDGTESPGEYLGPSLDLSRVWEGSPCASAADCSGSAKLTWYGDDLFVLVNVRDDLLGSVVMPADCKRHWRTDSVEIALDPRGASENTSTTFKAGLFPVTADPARGNPACFERDADNHQGPGRETAPGMVVASKAAGPYAGYALEAKIPLGLLPSAVDPQRLGLNLFIYDSDTQDLSGQTRLGWSTFGGVQGDPYRWGHARLAGYAPPAGRPTIAPDPVIPRTAALSVDSPQSILQSALDGVPLGGGPAAAAGARVRISS